MTHSLIFFGSDRFSAVALSELISLNHPPSLVVTDPPKPKGKKGIIEPNEVDILANTQKIKVMYYRDNIDTLTNLLTQQEYTGLSASFPHLFPSKLIDGFAGHLYNLHPSLLPQYRNVAPVPYALAMGDKITGITLFRISTGIDNGEIINQASEDILPTDSTPTLTPRLFIQGAKLFVDMLQGSVLCNTTDQDKGRNLVFTRRLTRESGYVEWIVLQKLLRNEAIIVSRDTQNPLINLRLTHHPERNLGILSDLIRALDGYEKVWTIAKTSKGDLPISFSLPLHEPSTMYHVLLPGKPRPISYNDFIKYYLQ